MSLHTYTNKQLYKLAGAGVYLLFVGVFVLAGVTLLPVHVAVLIGLMSLGGFAHIVGSKAYAYIAHKG